MPVREHIACWRETWQEASPRDRRIVMSSFVAGLWTMTTIAMAVKAVWP